MRPQLVYDDTCYVCTWVTEHAIYYGPFELVGLSNVTDDQRNRLPENFEECSHLLTNETVYWCGEAIERMFSVLAIVFGLLRRTPDYPAVRERLYRIVADNRPLIRKVIGSTSSRRDVSRLGRTSISGLGLVSKPQD